MKSKAELRDLEEGAIALVQVREDRDQTPWGPWKGREVDRCGFGIISPPPSFLFICYLPPP